MIRTGGRYVVTGGAGFIGSALVRHLLGERAASVLVLDSLTYAGNAANLAGCGLDPATLASADPRLSFEKADVCDAARVADAVAAFRPDAVFHLAAETHVDRSISAPALFAKTNFCGTESMLEASCRYFSSLHGAAKDRFAFVLVSTDEVFGEAEDGTRFTASSPYRPSSPYSASKAGADHLARAWRRTYGFPASVVNSSNNFGPRQHPEKLIPMAMERALAFEPVPLYGDGTQTRDWIYVDDAARAFAMAADAAAETGPFDALVGAGCEKTNLETVRTVCDALDEALPPPDGTRRRDLVRFVADRPGHDRRYAVDASEFAARTGWRPRETFASGIAATVAWRLGPEGAGPRAGRTEED